MANKGKNKCKRGTHSPVGEEQEWFKVKKKKNKKNRKLAKASRKKNR